MFFHHTRGETETESTKLPAWSLRWSPPWWPSAWPVSMLRTGTLAMPRSPELPSQDRVTWL